MPSIQGAVGVQNNVDSSALITTRMGKQGELNVSELHGRFYEQTYRANVFSGGMTLTSINNATFTSATTGATATPIVGVWNPASNSVNLVVLQATLAMTITALAATGGGPYVWMVSTGNNAITTGAAPYNRKTLAASGSNAKNMSGVALTGMTGTLAVLGGSALGGGSASNASFTATAASMQTTLAGFAENLDGSIIVPPGGVLALMATTTPAAHSAVSSLVWEEVLI
jgi:hypothetical protein